MAKIAKVQEVDVDLLRPYEHNAKIHGEDQVEKICKSIQEFGFISPCLIDNDYNVIAGHGRIMAAKRIGMKTVPCLFLEGLSEEQRKAYILADNKLTELGEWDSEIVAQELKKLDEAGFDVTITGFELDDTIIDTGDIDDAGIGDQIDDFVAGKDPISKRGDVWVLGKHRLMVGDSTLISDVQKLVSGAEMDLMVTDPPYNVAVKNSKGMGIKNDDMANDDFYNLLRDAFSNAAMVMRPGAAFYIWHADSEGTNFRNATRDAGLTIKENIIWVKNHFTLGRQDYQWKHEPCLYGWKDGDAHYFQNARNISTIIKEKPNIYEMDRPALIDYINELIGDSTVWNENKPVTDDLHPTMKPISLIQRQVKNSSKPGWKVIDLFGGSGSTLIACEELGRSCYMMELDPMYADVIVERWEGMTGEKAVLSDE